MAFRPAQFWDARWFAPFALLIFSPALAAALSVDVYLRPGELVAVDGVILPTLCFTDAATGPPALPSPVYRLNQGEDLVVTLHNNDDQPHGFEVLGIGGSDWVVAAGGSDTRTFSFPDAGTFIYRDHVDYPVNAGIGLVGMIEVRDPGLVADGEFTWFLGDHSQNWMTAADLGDPIDTSVYDPNYFTVNALAGFDTMGDPSAYVEGAVGDRLYIRVANGGLRLHTLHFHGYHVDIVRRNGTTLPAPISKDTIPVPVGETMELLLIPHQDGLFPIHDHVVLSVTANGVYPLGMIVFANITL